MLYVASFINQSLSIYFESYVVKCQAHMIYFVDEMSVDFFSCQNVNTPPQKRAFISFMFKTTCQKDNFIVNISVYETVKPCSVKKCAYTCLMAPQKKLRPGFNHVSNSLYKMTFRKTFIDLPWKELWHSSKLTHRKIKVFFIQSFCVSQPIYEYHILPLKVSWQNTHLFHYTKTLDIYLQDIT